MAENPLPSLVDVRVTTKLGAVYVFPDVGEEARKTLAGPTPSCTSLQLVNVSVAVLSIPWHIVASVEALWTVDGEEARSRTLWEHR